MRNLILIMLGLILLQPAAALAQYEVPTNLGEPAAQLAEMLTIYDTACLQGFPDDAAVQRTMAARNATPLSADELRSYLRGDPGTGWRLNGSTAQFVVTIEEPPFHACGVRTITAAGFVDLKPYRDLVSGFESGRAFVDLEPMDRVLSNHIHTRGTAEQFQSADGSFETLMVVTSTPADGYRANGETGTEVRFVHQFHAHD
jgi:hypothetical protein